MPKVSVVIPVYNAGKYLKRCVESLMRQSFTDFEVLLVDDGSADDSGEICDYYASRDERVKIFHKVNEGVSAARNFGLDRVKGDWVTFVDADDEILPGYLSKLLSLIDTETSMIVTNYIVEENERFADNQIVFEEGTLTAEQYLVKFFYNDNVRNEVWGRLYNRHDIGSLRFNTTIAIGEDLFFNLEVTTQHPYRKLLVNKA